MTSITTNENITISNTGGVVDVTISAADAVNITANGTSGNSSGNGQVNITSTGSGIQLDASSNTAGVIFLSAGDTSGGVQVNAGNYFSLDSDTITFADASGSEIDFQNDGTISISAGNGVSVDGALSVDSLKVGTHLIQGEGPLLTIASGAITVTHTFHAVDTEGNTSTDDITQLNGGLPGDIVVLRANNNSRDVVCRNVTAPSNLVIGNSFTLDGADDTISFIRKDSSTWLCQAQRNNA